MSEISELQKERTKVLVVEDDPIAAEVLRTGLDALGCAVVVVGTGEEAMDLLHREQWAVDCLLADIVLPGPVDGWTVGNEFRLQRPTAPVIFVSAYEQKNRSRQPHRSAFLYKPVHPAQLVRLFRDLNEAA
jgi:CheY-like chemotaxis protein